MSRVIEMPETQETVVHKSIDAILVAQIRIHGNSDSIPKAFSKLDAIVGSVATGSPIVIHHWGVGDEDGHDMDVCFPIKEILEGDGFTTTTLPAKEAMTMIHRGPYSDIGASYTEISTHTYERGHPIAESTREVYHHLDVNCPENTVIEIQTIHISQN
jgi:effector-binding domain-containing protein